MESRKCSSSSSTPLRLSQWAVLNLRLAKLGCTRWAEHRHPLKSQYWISDKYWLIDTSDGWKFAARNQHSSKKIAKHTETPIERHIKVQNSCSPYDGDWVYWSSRMGRHPEVNGPVAALLKRQKGKCPECKLYFKESKRYCEC